MMSKSLYVLETPIPLYFHVPKNMDQFGPAILST